MHTPRHVPLWLLVIDWLFGLGRLLLIGLVVAWAVWALFFSHAEFCGYWYDDPTVACENR